jgi:biotin operon repressor
LHGAAFLSDHRPMGLSPDLRNFIIARIPSVSHLEALLLLRSTGAAWPLEQLGARLYLSPSNTAKLVDDLQAQGLAVHLGSNAQYLPKSERLAAAVDALAAIYGRSLIEVTQLIHSVTEQKAHRFADAFKMRKEP